MPPNTTPPQPQTVTIRLTFNPATGLLDLQGPTENRLLFLGVLELARDAVNQHHHAQQRIVVPPADLKVMR